MNHAAPLKFIYQLEALSARSLEKAGYGCRSHQTEGKIVTEAGESVTLKLNIIEDAKHSTAFPTTLIQGLDWIYGKPKVEQR